MNTPKEKNLQIPHLFSKYQSSNYKENEYRNSANE